MLLLLLNRRWIDKADKMRVVALVSGGKDSSYNMMKCVAEGHEIVALANLHPKDKGSLCSLFICDYTLCVVIIRAFFLLIFNYNMAFTLFSCFCCHSQMNWIAICIKQLVIWA